MCTAGREGLGRINYGAELVNDRNGIIGPVRIGQVGLTGWTMYKLPFDPVPAASRRAVSVGGVPTLYRGAFTLTRVGDTFLDMRGWGKRIVFVNGINLGRYWNVGP